MSQSSSNAKNIRVISRNRYENRRYKLSIKKAIKSYLSSTQSIKVETNSKSKEKQSCLDALSVVYKRLDKAVKKKVLHKNTAARKKQKMAKILKWL